MKNKIQSLFNVEGWFGIAFILTGIATQVVTYVLMGDSLLSFVSGIAGVISVVLCSQRKLSFYFWGFLQIGTFMAICVNEHLYGKLFENGFYLITMIGGLLMWKRNEHCHTVETRVLNKLTLLFIVIHSLFTIFVFETVLAAIGGEQPFMDSLTTVFAIVAQLLMIYRYRESWLFWLVVDIACIIMWYNERNWCMTAQYIFWTMNCIYGLIKWNKQNIKP